MYRSNIVIASCAALFMALPVGPAQAQALLNDSGQTQCHNGTTLSAANCTSPVIGDGGTYPRQDARFGRDAAAVAGQLTKVGCTRLGSNSNALPCAAGFDFTAVCFDGTNNCADQPNTAGYSAATGSGNAHGGWACTQDNVTGLLWALHSGNDTWTNATNTASATNDVALARAATLCGFRNWRLPTRHELMSIVHHGAYNPAIDTNYFPAVPSQLTYWSSNPYVPISGNAWTVYFYDGYISGNSAATKSYSIRLVSGGAS
ncbi:MAG: DUF1566 domain-containing protein [Proteobacteria bacterium]|nr:DUF1566 domain-containing protein [Pseudomonadota bacterium]